LAYREITEKYGTATSESGNYSLNRRNFNIQLAKITGGFAFTGLSGSLLSSCDKTEPFKISLAEWSLHRALQSKKIDHLDFISLTKTEFGLDAIEYVNSFFFDKAQDQKYLNEMNTRANDHDVKSLLIMVILLVQEFIYINFRVKTLLRHEKWSYSNNFSHSFPTITVDNDPFGRGIFVIRNYYK